MNLKRTRDLIQKEFSEISKLLIKINRNLENINEKYQSYGNKVFVLDFPNKGWQIGVIVERDLDQKGFFVDFNNRSRILLIPNILVYTINEYSKLASLNQLPISQGKIIKVDWNLNNRSYKIIRER